MQARAISGPVGGGRAHPRLRQRGPALGRASCATPSALPTACTRRGRRSASRRGAACSSARRSGTASPRRCGSPSGSAARPSPFPATARRIADDVLGFAQQEQRHAHHHRQVDALALVRDPARLGRARPGAPRRQHQRARHRRRGACAGADPEEDRRHRGGRERARSAALRRCRCWRSRRRSASACYSARASASRTSISCS